MSIIIKGMEMPKDCPMCIAAHYNKLDEFTGCEIVSGKKYAAQRDAEYAKSSTRPDWCPLVPVPRHGRLGDLDALKVKAIERSEKCGVCVNVLDKVITAYDIETAPTIIPAEKGEKRQKPT